MIEIKFGDKVEATCRYDYSGPAGNFTFAQEIGTIIIGPPLPEISWDFNTIARWEQQVYVSPGSGKTAVMTFTVIETDGLNEGDTYDMNFEIGTGSQGAGTWKKIKRYFTNDCIKIQSAAAAAISNLSVV